MPARTPLLLDYSDAELLARAQCGDGEAFVALWQRALPSLRRQARDRTRCPETVEDLLAEVCCRAFAAVGGLRPGSAFQPWTSAILANLSNDLWKRERRRAAVPDAEPGEEEDFFLRRPDPAPGPEGQALIRLDLDEALAALEWLRWTHPSLAEAVFLRAVVGLRFTEMGGLAATRRSQFVRGCALIRRRLERPGEPEVEPGVKPQRPRRKAHRSGRRTARGAASAARTPGATGAMVAMVAMVAEGSR